jgi:hypothetical protein
MVLLLAKNCAAVVQGLVVVVVVVVEEDTAGGGGGILRCMVVVVCVGGVRFRDVSIQVVWGMVVDDEEACDDATADPSKDPRALWWRTCWDGTIIEGAGWGRFCTGDDDDDVVDDQQ